MTWNGSVKAAALLLIVPGLPARPRPSRPPAAAGGYVGGGKEGSEVVNEPCVVDQLQLGDHVCWIVDDDDQCLAAMARFVAVGLRERQRVLYFTESLLPAALLAGLQAHGVAVAQAVAAGQLQVYTAGDVYLAGGRFDPARVIDVLDRHVSEAVADGYAGCGWSATWRGRFAIRRACST